MLDYFAQNGDDFLPSILFWKMSWIFMIDNSGSMGPHAVDSKWLTPDVKDAVSYVERNQNGI